ncbi:MAG: hypothetical protein CVV31_09230 [Methanomicrobiales archaeon HGW-Methanomicrobiales-2]|jgi:hypothetical protein|nr:MAG: hypothetical protein CVV31_09230 [Methanomicrobiales archaeon HGW-Methanomicrobiales-2]
MSRARIERRLEALERDANPGISTWADLMTAVEEGRDPITLSPTMQGLFEHPAGRVTPAESMIP